MVNFGVKVFFKKAHVLGLVQKSNFYIFKKNLRYHVLYTVGKLKKNEIFEKKYYVKLFNFLGDMLFLIGPSKDPIF